MLADFPLRQTKTGAGCFTKVFAPLKKSFLRDAILRQLQLELARQTTAAEMARDEAISEESQPENKWDTHSQEAAYLAEGQSRLVTEIGASLNVYATVPLREFKSDEAIAIGAVVELESSDGKHTWYFLGPRAGGLELEYEGRSLLVVTPQSPLGRNLIGRRTGDQVQTGGRGAQATQRVVNVA
jgi:transcription elongation GreA/GreB family factor